jgi:hypothetical protein
VPRVVSLPGDQFEALLLGRHAQQLPGRDWRETLETYEQPAIDEGVRGELRDYVAQLRIELGDEPVPTPAF